MNAQACNGCDALDYVGELNESGVCNECSLDTAPPVHYHSGRRALGTCGGWEPSAEMLAIEKQFGAA